MPRKNHSPERTCLGCFRRDVKSAMLRIVVRDGAVVLDPTAGASGRGGYLHPVAGCLEKFCRSKSKQFRSLKAGISVSDRLRVAEEIGGRLDSGRNME